MRMVIAGGHGQIAMRLERQLAARGDEAVGLIRKPEQAQELRELGAEPVVCDLESASVAEVARILQGADVAVFAAGAGPGSTVERKDTVDRDAAVLLADAAEQAGVRRFLVVSSMGADAAHEGEEIFDAYLRAKGAADDAVRAHQDLDWTIVRPGGLTDDEGTGRVRLEPSTGRGSVPREDVAAVLAELARDTGTVGLTLEVIEGTTAVPAAVRAAAAG